MLMHLAIALVTYNLLEHVAPVRPAAGNHPGRGSGMRGTMPPGSVPRGSGTPPRPPSQLPAGIASTYRIMAGRSASVTGPYVNPAGASMMNGGGVEVQGSDEGMIGPGSSSNFTDRSRSYLVYHYADAFHNGDPWVQVRPLIWTTDGWPVTGQPLTPVPGSPIPPR